MSSVDVTQTKAMVGVYAERDYEAQPLRILISGMNPCDDGFFLPIIYGMLKSFCDQYDDLRTGCDWLDPIMLPETFSELDERYDFAHVDVLGVSCYSWNHAYQYALARAVKRANPNCVVIAGGPQVEWKTPDYFERNDMVDFAQPAEGEIVWRDTLRCIMAGFEGLDELRGTCTNPRFGDYVYKVAESVDLAKKPSPWLSMKEFWIDYAKRYSKHHLAACIETSRGCPYRCSYCDWGSKTNLRVRLIPEDIARAEIEFVVGTLKPWFMFWADANLGIVKRDVELARCFSECKKESGFPLWLYYNNNKNSYESNLEIAKCFRDAGLLTKYVLSLQHLDDEVLSAIGRTNLPKPEMEKLVRELYRIDYPIFTQLIAGCPGDTWEKWLATFDELMEVGVHGEYRTYPFGMFPNAPAAEAEYRKKWGIETVERPDSVAYFQLSTEELNETLSSSSYLVKASSYTSEEYERMWLLCWLVQAMHDHGLVRLVAIALRARGVPYAQFYRELFGWFFGIDGEGNPTGHTEMARFARPLMEHVHEWLVDPTAPFMMKNPQVNGMLEPEEALCMQILFDSDYFYDAFARFARIAFSTPNDLLDYQRDMIMLPEFDAARDGEVRLSKRWVSYFAEVERDPFTLHAWPSSPEEEPAQYGAYRVDVSSIKFPVKSWFARRGATRKRKAYYDQVVQHNVPGCRRVIFKNIAERCAPSMEVLPTARIKSLSA